MTLVQLSLGYRLWLRKVLHDLKGFLFGSGDFAFLEESLKSWVYPVDLEFTLQHENLYYAPKDSNGLPLRAYLSAGLRYNPTRLAAYALAHYNRYRLTGQENSRLQFLKVVDWFMCAPEGKWIYDYPWLNLKPPWLSAMAQGEGISVLVRAWTLSRNDQYLDQARRALVPLVLPLEAGGLRSELKDGSPFLEEYPTHPPAHVLNGFLYALIGLVDLQQVSEDLVKGAGIEVLLHTLEQHLYQWDTGFWSIYDLEYQRTGMPNLVTPSYHNLHVAQLSFLGKKMRCSTLLKVARRWANYAKQPICRWRAFWGKMRYRLKHPGQK